MFRVYSLVANEANNTTTTVQIDTDCRLAYERYLSFVTMVIDVLILSLSLPCDIVSFQMTLVVILKTRSELSPQRR
jgi:hypothetical protein